MRRWRKRRSRPVDIGCNRGGLRSGTPFLHHNQDMRVCPPDTVHNRFAEQRGWGTSLRASEVSDVSRVGEARLLLLRTGTRRCNRSARRPRHKGWIVIDYTFFYDRHRDVRQGTVGWVRRASIESTLLVVDSIGLVCEKIDKLVSKVTADPGRGSDRFDHKGQTDGALSAGAWRGCLFFK